MLLANIPTIPCVSWLLSYFCGHGNPSLPFSLFSLSDPLPFVLSLFSFLSPPRYHSFHMATAAPKLTSSFLSVPSPPHHAKLPLNHQFLLKPTSKSNSRNNFAISRTPSCKNKKLIVCEATQVSVAEESSPANDGRNWVPVVPLSALPKGERRVIIQDGETILLLWYKDDVFAIENRSPAEGAYTEGLLNAKLTQVPNFTITLSLSSLYIHTLIQYSMATPGQEEPKYIRTNI